MASKVEDQDEEGSCDILLEMSDNKILQAILDNVVAIKDDVKDLREEMKTGFNKVNERLDMQGKSLAFLEDDAPTREEFDNLENRVDKLEHKSASL